MLPETGITGDDAGFAIPKGQACRLRRGDC